MVSPKAVTGRVASGALNSGPNSGTINKGDINVATEAGGKIPADTQTDRHLLGHLRIFDLNNAITRAHRCACTHVDLGEKGVTAGLHFQTCFASSIYDLWA